VQIFKLTQKFSQLRIFTLFQKLYDYTAPLCCVLPSCVLLLRPCLASLRPLRPLPSCVLALMPCLDALPSCLALPFSASPCYAIFGVVYFGGIKKG
jgi:hypothetical protein